MPVIDRAAAVKAAMVSGILRPAPRRSSTFSAPVEISIRPAHMNRQAFISAWFIMCSRLPVSECCEAMARPSMI